MSDTTAGLLQVGLLLAALAACYRPLGAYMARVYTSEHDSRVERVIYRVIGVDPKADQRWPVYARALLAFSAVSVAGPVRTAAVPAEPAAEPRLPRGRAGPGVQHGSLVRDEHELAVLLGRVDHGPPGADVRARGAELRLGRGRHGRRGRPDPRVHPLAHRPDRQLLGRPGARQPAHPAADRRRSARSPCWRWVRFRTSPPAPRSPRSPGSRRRSPADRWPPRRPSRSSAPTAAASTTPTPRTRSRTPTRSATCWRSSCSCSSRCA